MKAQHETIPVATGNGLLLDADEMAEACRISRRYLWTLTAQRVIPVIRLGARCVRYDPKAVLAALQKLQVKAVS